MINYDNNKMISGESVNPDRFVEMHNRILRLRGGSDVQTECTAKPMMADQQQQLQLQLQQLQLQQQQIQQQLVRFLAMFTVLFN